VCSTKVYVIKLNQIIEQEQIDNFSINVSTWKPKLKSVKFKVEDEKVFSKLIGGDDKK